MLQSKKEEIILAFINNNLEDYRRKKIEQEVEEKYTKSQEFRLYIERDSDPEPWLEHETFVEQVKQEIDSQIKAIIDNLEVQRP